ncbi:MAG: ABC transporter ATP-binding protein [Thermomicrobiales bacterium]|nr:ABC transporter ATP-binding protein [Thermomicrobiales bacterium]
MAKNVLEVNDLKTQFFTRAGVVYAVDGVSFHVGEGETLGIVGESGCGKSVTATSIMRLIPSPPGKIVNGEILLSDESGTTDLLTLSESEMRHVRGHRVAMIFQDPMTSLNPVLTIGDQITEPLILHLGLSKREAEERAIDLLKRVGIPAAEDRINAYPHQFSGGMRQRVMIAIALSCNPRVLIADEPTTALDVTIQAQILELMMHLNHEFGTAIIMITHDLGVVAEICERVVVMYAGQIVETGDAKDLFNNPQHPYTIGLLNSVPQIGERVKDALTPIPGLPPDLLAPPVGCRFRPRCRFRQEKCETSPPLADVAPGQRARCWFPQGRGATPPDEAAVPAPAAARS